MQNWCTFPIKRYLDISGIQVLDNITQFYQPKLASCPEINDICSMNRKTSFFVCLIQLQSWTLATNYLLSFHLMFDLHVRLLWCWNLFFHENVTLKCLLWNELLLLDYNVSHRTNWSSYLHTWVIRTCAHEL